MRFESVPKGEMGDMSLQRREFGNDERTIPSRFDYSNRDGGRPAHWSALRAQAVVKAPLPDDRQSRYTIVQNWKNARDLAIRRREAPGLWSLSIGRAMDRCLQSFQTDERRLHVRLLSALFPDSIDLSMNGFPRDVGTDSVYFYNQIPQKQLH